MKSKKHVKSKESHDTNKCTDCKSLGKACPRFRLDATESDDFGTPFPEFRKTLAEEVGEIGVKLRGFAPNPHVHRFDSGAIRSTDGDDTRYDLISPIAMRRLAETYAEGFVKYGAGNWLKGIPQSNLFNHLQRHLLMYQAGDRSEDHLGHALWNLVTLTHFDETRPDLCDLTQNVTEKKNAQAG